MPKIDALFTEMIKAGASDLHMVPGLPPMLRLKGDLVPTKHKPLSHKLNEQLFFEMMNEDQKKRLQTTLELESVPGPGWVGYTGCLRHRAFFRSPAERLRRGRGKCARLGSPGSQCLDQWPDRQHPGGDWISLIYRLSRRGI